MSEKIKEYRVGVLSDTHGHLPFDVQRAFEGVDLIIHAGDLDRQKVLQDLACIAPVKAVRGNMDVGDWADSLPKTRIVRARNRCLYVLHDLDQIDVDPAQSGFDAVIHGHLHRPSLVHREGVRFINPGSPTRPRGNSVPSGAILNISKYSMDVTFVAFD